MRKQTRSTSQKYINWLKMFVNYNRTGACKHVDKDFPLRKVLTSGTLSRKRSKRNDLILDYKVFELMENAADVMAVTGFF